jgi:hypothetical protein
MQSLKCRLRPLYTTKLSIQYSVEKVFQISIKALSRLTEKINFEGENIVEQSTQNGKMNAASEKHIFLTIRNYIFPR